MKSSHLRNSHSRRSVHSWKWSKGGAPVRIETEKAAAAEVNEEGMPRKEIRTEDRAVDSRDREDVVSLQAAKMQRYGPGTKGPDCGAIGGDQRWC